MTLPLAYDQRPSDETIGNAFAAAMAAYPERIAVEDEVSSLTYRELGGMVAPLARAIEQAAAPGVPVGIMLPVGVPAIAAILAVVATGRPYLAMDPDFPTERNRLMVDHTGLAAVVVDDGTAATMREIAPGLPQILVERFDADAIGKFTATARPQDLAYIFFTSGSTSRPKAVYQNHRNIVYEVHQHIAALGIVPDDRISLAFSPSVAGSLRDIFGALLAGACLSIVDVKRLGLQRARQHIATRRLTMWHSVPAIFRALFGDGVDDPPEWWRSVRLVYLAGDRIVPADVALFDRRFGDSCRLFLEIAATETNGFAHWFVEPRTRAESALVPVGRPRPDKPVTLISEDGNDVPPGAIGEIVVTGCTLALGYWHDEELTRERFVPSAAMPDAISYRTGDLGRFTPDGLLEYIGRKDRRVKVRGNTVHLAEVEAVIARCPGLAEVGVVAQATTDTILVAYCVAAQGEVVTEAMLRQLCRDRLPSAMRPARFVMMAALPKLSNGKLDLIGLAALDANTTRPAASSGATEGSLTGIVQRAWEQYLPSDSFEANAGFEAAGGNSLMALELIVALERLLGRYVPPGLLDLQSRPSDLIQRLGQSGDDDLATDDRRPLLVYFPGIWGDDVSASEFLRGLSSHFQVWTPDFRLGGANPLVAFDTERYFAAIRAEILCRGPPPRLWLVGYSFGGKIAAEMARRFMAEGVAVEAVASLDGEAGLISRRRLNAVLRHPREAVGTRLRHGKKRYGGWAPYLGNALAIRLVRAMAARGGGRSLEALVALVARFATAEMHFRVMRDATRLIRSHAFGDIPAAPLPTDLWLFVTDDPWHDPAHPDLGWTGRCRGLNVINVGGAHMTMLAHPTSETLMVKLAALEVSLRPRNAAAR